MHRDRQRGRLRLQIVPARRSQRPGRILELVAAKTYLENPPRSFAGKPIFLRSVMFGLDRADYSLRPRNTAVAVGCDVFPIGCAVSAADTLIPPTDLKASPDGYRQRWKKSRLFQTPGRGRLPCVPTMRGFFL